MSKTKKTREHSLHFHLGLYVALAAILVTAAKSSSEMLRVAYALPMHYNIAESANMREAEILHGHANLVIARRVHVAGQ